MPRTRFDTTGDQSSANIQVQGGDTYNRETGQFTSGPREGQGPRREYIRDYPPVGSGDPPPRGTDSGGTSPSLSTPRLKVPDPAESGLDRLFGRD